MKQFFFLIIFANLMFADFYREDGVVIDTATNLMWQDDYSGNGGDIPDLSWQEAIDYCQMLNLNGYEDWRLPNKNELISIVDYSVVEPTSDEVFENFNITYWGFWSATSGDEEGKKGAWLVNFGFGAIHNHYKGDPFSVRCVRGGVQPTIKRTDVLQDFSQDEGTAITDIDLSAYFTHAHGLDLSYSVSGLPSGLTLNDSTISGTVANVVADTNSTVKVEVTDETGSTLDESFVITVKNNDTVAPSLIDYDLNGLDTQGESGSGTMTFDESITNVQKIEFVDASDSTSLSGITNVSINSNKVSFDYTAPNAASVIIEVKAEDSSGNSKTESTTEIELTAPEAA